jgi:hypothetical protein
MVKSPLDGHCIQEWNDPVCEARKVTNKGLCEARKSAEKLRCEAEKAAEKPSCETVKEAYKRVLATGADYANVESNDLALSGTGQVCLKDASCDRSGWRVCFVEL